MIQKSGVLFRDTLEKPYSVYFAYVFWVHEQEWYDRQLIKYMRTLSISRKILRNENALYHSLLAVIFFWVVHKIIVNFKSDLMKCNNSQTDICVWRICEFQLPKEGIYPKGLLSFMSPIFMSPIFPRVNFVRKWRYKKEERGKIMKKKDEHQSVGWY